MFTGSNLLLGVRNNKMANTRYTYPKTGNLGQTYPRVNTGGNQQVTLKDISDDQLDKSLADSMTADWEQVLPNLYDLYANQSAMLGETNSLRQARLDAAALGQRNSAIQQRQLGRANVNLSPSQQRAMALKNSMQNTGIGNAMVNNAVSQRYDQNNSARMNLLASVNAMKSGSQANLSQIVGNQSARNQAAADANTARKSSNLGLFGQLAGAGIGYMLGGF